MRKKEKEKDRGQGRLRCEIPEVKHIGVFALAADAIGATDAIGTTDANGANGASSSTGAANRAVKRFQTKARLQWQDTPSVPSLVL